MGEEEREGSVHFDFIQKREIESKIKVQAISQGHTKKQLIICNDMEKKRSSQIKSDSWFQNAK